uniref:Uncharacterized protein n=1 Tax=Aplanochytrium stocchinoi TaxID=215587 RepID=A0A7S3PM55_9STRA|eukprot:CAMPEP_0204836502 /NCGR_PEP_ID=MMETSP1346-20131115/25312_1 /ASSEMBLY_ACC=CAM_ASM_000771 /TAXON_ID=215587 /ORGANISM="Aplanochytrium stocchinoi, Strain GSBS06" /LENGTH=330 /DNA_ID=CAMNT_0051971271 /DNA_START=214 /DNA_END=1206 /DNA_ORIENTATION=-
MAKERRRDASSDDDYHHNKYDAICHDAYDNKSKEKPSKLSCLLVIPGARKNIISLASDCQQNPAKTSKRLVWKVIFYVWCIAVVVSILSLLGFSVNPLSIATNGNGNGITDEDSVSSSNTLTGAWQNMIPEVFQGLAFTEDTEDDEEEEGIKEEEEAEEVIPQQILPTAPKQGNKINKKLEGMLACEELKCINACNKKIKPKCEKSTSCRKERDKLCHRRCRKQRCEERCKDEPKFGYVEREQRMEKCKDGCEGPTAAHNKCIKKCHSQFKPCKSRCHEIASKFHCDNPDIVKQPPPPPPPKVAEAQTPSAGRGAKKSTIELLTEDPEMI